MDTVHGGVLVSHGDRSWPLAPGDELTIGRSLTCAVQLRDSEISRHACLLKVEAYLVVVINQSRQKPLVLRPPAGEDRRVGPGAATTSLPYRLFAVVFAGNDEVPVAVTVDARGLPPLPGPVADPREKPTRGADDLIGAEGVALGGPRPGRRQAALLTPSQRVVLLALCEPMLTRNGDQARPRSTEEIARRLGLAADYVRNVLKEVRGRLSDAGVAGLVPNGVPGADLRRELARWAVESGAVGADDLGDLPVAPR